MDIEPVKFLLVDDVEENLFILDALLRRDDLVLLKAHSGREALELLLEHEVALALLDVHMPEMDGFELAELMRGAERTKHIPIIFVTAGNRDPLRTFKGYESGAVDFLYKPIEPFVLKSKADVFYELYKQRKECAQALQMNDMFVGILGHDLRNPLSTLVTGIEVLTAQLRDEAQRRTLERMKLAGRRMGDMIEQMLDLTRARLLDHVGLARGRSRADFAELARRAIDELRGAYPGRRIDFRSAAPSVTHGDPDRLLQLLSNIIGNALQHGEEGTPVTVEVGATEHEVVLTVHNHGTIPADVLPSLFDPFRKRNEVRARSKGLGLGLYISQQIARAHGGTVEATSSSEAGTVLRVRVPLRNPEASLPETAERVRTVLVVDDDRYTRASLQEAFESAGYRTFTASSGLEALQHLADEQRRPDIVMHEVVLPVEDGHRVYDAIESDPALSHVTIVASRSSPGPGSARVEVVPKPFRLEQLLRTVATLCERAGA
jgi:two-component system sensor histidine kinase/response regulator